MRTIHIVIVLLLFAAVCSAQAPGAAAGTPPPAPCPSAEARQFDFWSGEWTLAGKMRVQPGEERWTVTEATNSIHPILGACVMLENFRDATPGGLTGMSVSSWSPRTRQWQQTWVDNQGSYISLAGEFRDGRMTLQTTPRRLPDGSTGINRMVFHHIAADSLIWDWELSHDGGRTWELLWGITYRRRP
ncbi:MAG: DUF1579 family protein [Gemmatimonadetes bacterium]|nr:DUF1579 family protein [Gemmatimonadota bacterium]